MPARPLVRHQLPQAAWQKGLTVAMIGTALMGHKQIILDARIRRPTNVTRPTALVAEPKALQVNVSQACETGLARAVAEARRARWLEENAQAIEDHNAMA